MKIVVSVTITPPRRYRPLSWPVYYRIDSLSIIVTLFWGTVMVFLYRGLLSAGDSNVLESMSSFRRGFVVRFRVRTGIPKTAYFSVLKVGTGVRVLQPIPKMGQTVRQYAAGLLTVRE